MKFESIIWVIVILVIVASKIRKHLIQDKKGAPKKEPGWKKMLGDVVSQIREELEAGSKRASAEQTGWEQITPDDSGPVTTVWEKDDGFDIPLSLPETDILEKISPEAKKIAVSQPAPLYKDTDYARQDLRKAVVWSEILAPPLALRSEIKDQW